MARWPLLPLLLALSLNSLIALAPPGLVAACSCARASDQERFDCADLVFLGTVIDRHDPKAGAPVFTGGDPITWTFIVHEVRKGEAGQRITVTSARSAVSCGFFFTLGARYLVNAYEDNGVLTTNYCSGNSPPSGGAAAVPGWSPLRRIEVEWGHEAPFRAIALAGLAVMIVAAAGGLLWRYRHR